MSDGYTVDDDIVEAAKAVAPLADRGGVIEVQDNGAFGRAMSRMAMAFDSWSPSATIIADASDLLDTACYLVLPPQLDPVLRVREIEALLVQAQAAVQKMQS
jgi:hypothetical protein